MDKDFDHIKELFDSDGIKAPERLSEESVMAMLKDADKSVAETQAAAAAVAAPDTRERTRAVRRKIPARRIAAIAACLVIALVGAPQAIRMMSAPATDASDESGLHTFSDRSEIERLISDIYADDHTGRDIDYRWYNYEDEGVLYDTGGDIVYEGAGDMAPMDDGSAAPTFDLTNGTKGGVTSDDHSETYLQVEEVDEADIIKTDGRYIYYVTYTSEVVIFEAESGEVRKLSTIGSSGVENYIHDIYLKGDILVTVGRVYDDDGESTAIVTYDISDRSHPEVMYEHKQTGDIVSSRMVGDYVYLVTSETVYKGGRVLPWCTMDGEYNEIPVTDICCVPDPKSASYTILSALDITSGSAGKSARKAIFGASEDIYCTDHSLYVAALGWDEDGTARTRIVRASLDGLKIKFEKTGQVSGYIDSQFSMDERDGYFRVATTSVRDGMDVNNLYILDSDLNEAGKISGFARNESIRAVRFLGDKAYVITYEQIDPLFIIDLSDPTDPRIEGEVMIDGFSTLLIPVSEGRLLGIGHATGDNGYGGEYDSGLKLALFDISDPSEPKVIASREFEDMYSPAQDTHLALIVNSKEGWYAIPYNVWTFSDDPEDEYDHDYDSGILVFRADDDLSVTDQHSFGENDIRRGVYIGEYIYGFDSHGFAGSFTLSE